MPHLGHFLGYHVRPALLVCWLGEHGHKDILGHCTKRLERVFPKLAMDDLQESVVEMDSKIGFQHVPESQNAHQLFDALIVKLHLLRLEEVNRLLLELGWGFCGLHHTQHDARAR